MRSRLLGYASCIVLLATPLSARAQVSVPNTFQPNTTARASEVNANFSAVVSGVNAAQTLATNAQSTANTAKSTADAAQASVLTKVSKAGDTMTGALTVPGIVYSSPKTQRELLAMDDFACLDPSDCPAENHNGLWISSTIGQTLVLSARLHMPHGARLVDVWCSFNDNSASNASFRVLVDTIDFTGIGWTVLTNTISTSGTSLSVQTLQASSSVIPSNWTSAGLTADNSRKAFFVQVNVPYDDGFTPAPFNGDDLALHGCYYDYSVTQP